MEVWFRWVSFSFRGDFQVRFRGSNCPWAKLLQLRQVDKNQIFGSARKQFALFWVGWADAECSSSKNHPVAKRWNTQTKKRQISGEVANFGWKSRVILGAQVELFSRLIVNQGVIPLSDHSNWLHLLAQKNGDPNAMGGYRYIGEALVSGWFWKSKSSCQYLPSFLRRWVLFGGANFQPNSSYLKVMLFFCTEHSKTFTCSWLPFTQHCGSKSLSCFVWFLLHHGLWCVLRILQGREGAFHRLSKALNWTTKTHTIIF